MKSAFESGCFEQVVVSTDDDEIDQAARKEGATVMRRSARLAGDTAKSVDVVAEVIETLGHRDVDEVVLLPVTSPLRTGDDVSQALDLLASQRDALSVVSICEYEFPPAFALTISDGRVVALFPEHYAGGRSQRSEVPQHFRPNGAIYASTAKVFMARRTFFTERTVGYLMPPERSIDVDRPYDLVVAEAMLRQREINLE